MPHEQLLRLFLALDIPEQQKSLLARAQSRMKQALQKGTYAEPENLHITLHFLGDTAVSKLPSLIEAFNNIPMPVMTFAFDHLMFLPDATKARVAAVGLTGDLLLLNELYSHLGTILKSIGFRLDHRKYLPHLTLVRFKIPPGAEMAQEATRATQSLFENPQPFRVGQFTLYQSTFDAKEGRYAALGRFPKQSPLIK